MQKKQLQDLFKQYDERTQRILREALRLEQQYITYPFSTHSSAMREVKDKIDAVIEEVVKS